MRNLRSNVFCLRAFTRQLSFQAIFFLSAVLVSTACAQETPPLYDNLGDRSRPITTSSEQAQAYFDQGMQLAYAFGRSKAVASFREAQRLDPECAMCYWGEAWALGPYVNRISPPGHEYAREAMQQAQKYASKGTAAEKALINAMAVRYPEEFSRDASDTRDSAYAAAAREVVRRFPGDDDAGTLYAEAEMVRTAKDYWREDGSPRPVVAKALDVLERITSRNLQHPGACHLYIHAMEASPHPERGMACADVIDSLIPGASHIQHMPYHIYINTGYYGKAVEANRKARQMDRLARRDSAVAIYPIHNLNTLRYAATMDGQSALAIRSAKDLRKTYFPNAQALYVLTLSRFGQWEEVLAASANVEDAFEKTVVHYGKGLAHLRSGRADSARVYLEMLSQQAKATPTDQLVGMYPYAEGDVLQMATLQLQAEIEAVEGKHDAAIRRLRKAVRIEDRFGYDDSEFWPIPTRHILGAILLEAGRPAEAEAVYRADLEDHPRNGWSLFGLTESLRAQGKEDAAREAEQQFEEVWPRADAKLEASRY